MPLYDYECTCGVRCEINVPIDARDSQYCDCNRPLHRRLAAPMGKVKGPATGASADQYTADRLGVPLKELPAGLRS